MPTIEMLLQLPIGIRSERDSIVDHRDQLAGLAIESASTNMACLGAAAMISMPAGSSLAVLGIRNRS